MPRPVPHALLGLLLLTLASPLTSCARLSPVNDGPRVPPLAPTEAGGPESDQELIVIVNGHAIDRAEFLRRVVEKAGSNTLRMEIVLDELVRQEAEKRDIEVTAREVDEATESFIRGMAEERGGMEKLEAEFKARGFPLDAFRQDLRPQVRQELLRRRLVQSFRKIDDAMLRRYYDETYRKKRYVVRHIAYSFLPPAGEPEREIGGLKLEAFERARRAVERIRAGHDFATLARAESDDKVTSQQGGLLPTAVSDDSSMPPRFKEAIFALEPGEVSDPIENPGGPAWHIFQLTDVIPSQSYVDCVDEMRRELLERDPAPQEIAEVLTTLERAASIEWPR